MTRPMTAQEPSDATPIAQGHNTRPKTGSHVLVEALEQLGVEVVFGYPGGAIMPIYDALPGSKLKHILVRHEQAAALAADAWGRMTGKAGVCMATSGPGATNLVTGIANAFMDSIPMVAITGQVPQAIMGTDGFQEVDVFGITMPVVKHSVILRDPSKIAETLAECFHIAESGRPGPVLIDVPKDVATAVIESSQPAVRPTVRARVAADEASVKAGIDIINSAKKPLLYVGGGVARAGAVEELRAFAKETGIPEVSTLQGLGCLPTWDDQHLGMLGMHGGKAANMAVQESDLLIVCGARFDDRATGRLDSFAPNARVVHLDRDPAEINKLRNADVGIQGDLAKAMQGLSAARPEIDAWCSHTQDEKVTHAMRYDAPGKGVFAPLFLKELSEAAGDDFVAVCDVGQHQMWVAQHCRFSRPQAHLTSGGLGTMGYGVPAGVGAKLAEPEATVVTVTGDGSVMMNIHELATIRRYRVPLKIVLFDNSTLGLVRQWQELFFEENFSEVDLFDNPDFAELAEAFGIEAFTVTKRDDTDSAIDRLLSCNGPILAHVRIDPMENVWPLVPPGRSNAEMMEA